MSRTYVADGLNRYASVSGASYAYDARGNLTNDGVRRFCFDLENRLTGVAPVSLDPCAAPSTLALGYDPLGRLQQTSAGTTATQFLYDGDRLVAEFDGAGALLRRYVHGAGVDEPLVWYEGAGTGDRRHLAADNQGSVIASSGAGVTRYAYGPYGEPDTWAGGRFRYTGQIALSEVALYHYKARVYDPVLGRFLQTDPVGYQDQMNLYAYVGNDPYNAADPTGKCGFVCTGIVGTAVGAVAGGALGFVTNAIVQAATKGVDRVDLAEAKGAAVVGAIAGGTAGLILGTAGAGTGVALRLNAAATAFAQSKGAAAGISGATTFATAKGSTGERAVAAAASAVTAYVAAPVGAGAALITEPGVGAAGGQFLGTQAGILAGEIANPVIQFFGEQTSQVPENVDKSVKRELNAWGHSPASPEGARHDDPKYRRGF